MSYQSPLWVVSQFEYPKIGTFGDSESQPHLLYCETSAAEWLNERQSVCQGS
jgi:hypothetical protein